jgi:hypothetical protein
MPDYLEHAPEGQPHGRVVIDDQQVRHGIGDYGTAPAGRPWSRGRKMLGYARGMSLPRKRFWLPGRMT